MTYISRLCRVCSIIGLTIIPLAATIQSDEPNLIVIMTDEHNLRTLGCYRDQMKKSQSFVWGDGIKVDTPHIDSLARDGALFTNFNTVAPLCTPSRASFMTGLYPAFTGASENHLPMDQNAVTFAKVLQTKKDYYTGYFGKWHLNGDIKPGFQDKDRRFGFNENKYQFNRGHWKFLEEDVESGIVNAYDYRKSGKVKGSLEEAYTTDFLFRKAFDFVGRQVKRNRNFALMLSIPDPHGPNDVRPPYDTMFNSMNFNLPATGVAAFRKSPANPGWSFINTDLENANKIIASIENDEKWQRDLRNYFGMVKLIDDKIGELLSFLKQSGIDENTIVVFTSDHGDLLGEHGKYNKGRPYKTSAGVPFLIRYPKHIKEGKVVKTAYSSPDFAPTILSLMGIDYSNMNFQGIDGSGELLDDRAVNYRAQVRFIADSKQAKWAAAVDREYKLVLSKVEPFLFDLKEDPDELLNFHGNDKYKNITDTLESALLVAMIDYKFSLADKPIILYDRPVCLDTKNHIPSFPNQVCSDLLREKHQNKCKLDEVSNTCPDACGICCQDTRGEIGYNGNVINCNDVKANQRTYCKTNIISKFCPVTCLECIPEPSANPSSAPTVSHAPIVVPSTDPSTSPSTAPSYKPSIEPSSIPSRHPTGVTSTMPSTSPSPVPSYKPSIEPSSISSRHPTDVTSTMPSTSPSPVPSYKSSIAPSSTSSRHPTGVPSTDPSISPSPVPRYKPSIEPSIISSRHPTGVPSTDPSISPSAVPSYNPTIEPSSISSRHPTDMPSTDPSISPSAVPSYKPSIEPGSVLSRHPSDVTNTDPSISSSPVPSYKPSIEPGSVLSMHPTDVTNTDPSISPSPVPSYTPSIEPSIISSRHPSDVTSTMPSTSPSPVPSYQSSIEPSSISSRLPTGVPSTDPSTSQSPAPSYKPSIAPSIISSRHPSGVTSTDPSISPSPVPSYNPTIEPSSVPSRHPTGVTSTGPFVSLSTAPSYNPTIEPSPNPSKNPTGVTSTDPSTSLSIVPSYIPTIEPSSIPSKYPTVASSAGPSTSPSPVPSYNLITEPSSIPSKHLTVLPSAGSSTDPSAVPSSISSIKPSSIPSKYPTVAPSTGPSASPLTASSNNLTAELSLIPRESPSILPSLLNHMSRSPSITCADNLTFYITIKERTCAWINIAVERREKQCNIPEVRFACPHTCGICCKDDPKYIFFADNNIFLARNCEWLREDDRNVKELCNEMVSFDGKLIKEGCRQSCNNCNDL